MKRIILASGSPRRKQLLSWAELAFEVMPSDADEDFPAEMRVSEVPEFIAAKKGRVVFDRLDDSEKGSVCVIAADTVVVVDDTIIGMPTDRGDAIRILKTISGRTHRVITGVFIMTGASVSSFNDVTEVEFYALSEDQITYYVDQYKPYDKAGAYAIQEWIGVIGIKRISGDFYNVMGLPVSKVMKTLQDLR